jgi:hypothetical protein
MHIHTNIHTYIHTYTQEMRTVISQAMIEGVEETYSSLSDISDDSEDEDEDEDSESESRQKR